MLPLVSVFWLNYNSMHVINVVKKSLDAVLRLGYPDFEVIVVDNNSTDGSREAIEKYLENKEPSGVRVKFIKLSRNLGFSDGINIAYRARDKNSMYVAVINNDAIPNSDYLKKLVEFSEENWDVGAVQGVVTNLHNKFLIDSAGGFLNEILMSNFSYRGKPVSIISKPFTVSYVEGTMPLYRVKAIEDAVGGNIMYVPGSFMYYLEDVFLSFKLWNSGYKCVVVPVVTGRHYREATTKKHFRYAKRYYYLLRNRVALLYITNSKYKKAFFLKCLRSLLLSRIGLAERRKILRALVDGIRFGRQLQEKYGTIDLHRIPLIKTSLKAIL